MDFPPTIRGANLAEKQRLPLLIGVGTSDTIPEAMCLAVEPVFPVSLTRDLQFPQGFQTSLRDHFSHCVTREPRDLLSHVRRIILSNEHGDSSDAFAALVDLFIALGGKGLRLRRRMLELSKAKLQPQEYGRLRDALAAGLSAASLDFVPGALLCSGASRAMLLVEAGIKPKSAVERDPLTEAREYMEYSQIDEARNILEQAVLRDPTRQELHRELLDIYRSTRDVGNFGRMFQKLDGEANPMREEWRELAEFLRSLNV
jgi:hypothetical protein